MSNATTLEFRTNSFELSKNFRFQFTGSRGDNRVRTGYLFLSNHKGVETIYVMQASTVIKDEYSLEEIEQHERLNAMKPIALGDTVTVNGAEYTVKILGDFSDAGYLIKKPLF